MKIHHIGYIVKNIEKAIPLFQIMGYEVECPTVYDDFREADICFLINGDYRVELVSATSKSSVVAEMQKKIGNAPYHICYEVDDLEKAISDLRQYRFVIWQEPHEAVALNGKRVAFLTSGKVGMIELLEQKKK